MFVLLLFGTALFADLIDISHIAIARIANLVLF